MNTAADDRSDWTEGEYLREIARLTRQRDEWNITGQSDWDSDADLAGCIRDLEDELYILQHPDMFAPTTANTKEAA